jgi:acyl-CoA thioesterase I
MSFVRPPRRRFVHALAAAAASLASDGFAATGRTTHPFCVVTFGDSILDCAHYNDRGVHPAQLIVRNDDALFPDYRGRDLVSIGPAELVHRAQDGARVDALARQARGLRVREPAVALITIGGNDLLGGLAADSGRGLATFEQQLSTFLRGLPVRPVLLGTVYDPTFGDDRRNFLGVDARIARANLDRMNAILAALGAQHGRLVDLHRHFLRGDDSWFTRTIEPSLRGASEVRAAFLPEVLRVRAA